MKPLMIISCPIDCYAGYGARARDFVKSLIKIGTYDIKILPQRWGNTRWGYLDDHDEKELKSLLITEIKAKPDFWVQCTLPNEFTPIGRFNIGLTAAMETDLCDVSWVDGCNKMDLILVSSNHSKQSLLNTAYSPKTGGVSPVRITTPIKVLFEGVNLELQDSYTVDKQMDIHLKSIPELDRFLVLGHWMQGDIGEDRKNIGLTVKLFLETFKNSKKPMPALILKTHKGTGCAISLHRVQKAIEDIRKEFKPSDKLPNIYLIHGDVSEEAMHTLYKSSLTGVICLTKGEGFGRTLLEATVYGIPIIASNWSGHLDFLPNAEVTLVDGALKNVHPSAVVPNMILPEAKWFSPNPVKFKQALKQFVKSKRQRVQDAKRLKYLNRREFSLDSMTDTLASILGQVKLINKKWQFLI